MGFRSIGALGRGGMAEVSLALRDDARSGEPSVVVVKRLRSDLTQHADLQDMFLEEARISASLEHPNVVRTYDAGRDASGAFVAMEYLPGQSMGAMLARVGLAHIDYDFCLDVLLGTLEGLEYVHELLDAAGRAMGLVHRDISPPNVFITYDGQIKVLDFGIAKALGSPIRTRTGVVKGKVAYMAPEQALGQAVDARADLYAVGVMLWEMTSQRRRWPLSKPEGVILHELCQPHEPESPAAEARGLPGLANDVCSRALAFEPAQRYPSARAMLADLRELAQLLGRRRSAGEVGAYVARQFADERRRQARQIEDALAGHGNEPSEGRQFAGTRVVPREAPTHSVFERPLDTLAIANTTPVSDVNGAAAPGVTPASYSDPPALSGPLNEGSVVGEYRIIKQLGRGTFGTVYHAQHTIIGKQVAIKLLNAPYSQDAQIVQRFVDEARAVNRIAHPNIVDIFGFGELSDGRKFCIMELLDGETLAAYAVRHQPCPWADSVAVLAQVAAALDAAHEAGIVHRDLKPENIFISGSTQVPGLDGKIVKLLDFGIAKVADGDQRSTASGVVLGTPVYMSPEQCRGVRVDRRTDIYSLGVVAFELLTGVLPFVGENAMQLIAQHITATPKPPTQVNPSLPKAIDDALLGMLAKAPEARPARATEAVDALAAALGIHISFRQPPPVSPPAAGTKTARAQLLVVAAVLLIAGVVVGGWFSNRPRDTLAVVAESATLPASSPPAPAAPAVPTLEADRSVTLRVSGEPVGAKIMDGMRELGSLGEALQLERSDKELVLQVKAPGFSQQELRVVPSRDLELSVTLRRVQPAKAKQDDGLLY